MKWFDKCLEWLEPRPRYQNLVCVLLSFAILILPASCSQLMMRADGGLGPIDCRTNHSIVRAKNIEFLLEKPGGRVDPWDYQWAQAIREQTTQCWNELDR